MGKIRVAALGDEQSEQEQKRRADARRQTKQSKKPFGKTQGKAKVEGVGLKGGERVAVVEGTDIKPEFQKPEEENGEGTTENKKSKKAKKTHVRSKRYTEVAALVDKTKLYPLTNAVALVKKTSTTTFDGTVELHININPETNGGKPEMRGSVSLPHGTGKKVRVTIADDAILAEIEAGKINFDILVAHPSMMPKLAKVARVLGPKGLMPNPKTGTVNENPEKRAKELAAGQVNYKNEPDQPIIHMSVGKVSFEEKQLAENITAVLDAIGRNKIVKATVTATMGPGIKLSL